MQHEVKKVMMIINEIVTMFLLEGANDLDISIKRDDHSSHISILYRNCDYDDELIEKMKYNLNAQRQSEVEGYYWQLVGDDNNGDELYLVGAMIDEAQVERRNEDLYIHFSRIH